MKYVQACNVSCVQACNVFCHLKKKVKGAFITRGLPGGGFRNPTAIRYQYRFAQETSLALAARTSYGLYKLFRPAWSRKPKI